MLYDVRLFSLCCKKLKNQQFQSLRCLLSPEFFYFVVNALFDCAVLVQQSLEGPQQPATPQRFL